MKNNIDNLNEETKFIVTEDNFQEVVSKLKSKQLPLNRKYYFICGDCKEETLVFGYNLRNKKFLLCGKCHRKKLFTERYGGPSPFCSPEIQKKAFDNNRANHGGILACQTPETKEKIKNVCLEKFGLPYAYSAEIKEKARQTAYKHYGVYETFLRPGFREIRKKAMLEKYGVEYYTQDPEWAERSFKKFYEETGRKGTAKGYSYDGHNFDSSWELAYYIWLRDNKRNFEVHPGKLQYKDKNNQIHNYYPDFKVDDKYIEIKGDHFFDKDGNPKGIYGNWEDKYNFIISHPDIIMLRERDLKEPMNYMRSNYGNNLYKECRNIINKT